MNHIKYIYSKKLDESSINDKVESSYNEFLNNGFLQNMVFNRIK